MMTGRRARPLKPHLATRLRGVAFSYPEIGETRQELPDGYHHVHREVVVGSGRRRFVEIADAIATWQVQLGAGLRVDASSETIEAGTVARVGIGVGPLRLKAPVRVVYVIEEADRRGFAYGTLVGHPVSGEELFCVELRDNNTVVFVVTAFSRPRTRLARMAGPVGRLGQRAITARYLRAMRTWVLRT
ncbi:DUF1990 domain-containing protein [Nocardia sp. 348MFTsu5.1]|uniref:DUF1990 family protein n=1 Tax=Nocardia sp. 348MFTsu5.1 TaxID=1172185 RepID=UPI00037011FE